VLYKKLLNCFFSRTNNANTQFPIGSTINQKDFENYLNKIYPTNDDNSKPKKIGIILVPAFEWIDVLSQASACKVKTKKKFSQKRFLILFL
jgi:hypothetical protein